jgi:hypothetical protein
VGKITVKAGLLQGLAQALVAISSQRSAATTSYWLTKLHRKVTAELRDFEIARKKLCETHGELDKEQPTPGQQSYSFPTEEARAEFNKAYEVLANTDVVLTRVRTFSIDEFSKMELSMQQIDALAPVISEFIEDGEDAEPEDSTSSD